MFYLTPFTHKSNQAKVYDPFKEFENFERSFFGGNGFESVMRTDITEAENEYILEAELPGFSKDEINIDIQNDVLTVSAEKKSGEEQKDGNGNIIRRERRYGSYSRSFDISEINSEKISAEYENGILKLILPKKEIEIPASRRIEIK